MGRYGGHLPQGGPPRRARAGGATGYTLPNAAVLGYNGDKPVFFGRYWWTGIPGPLAPKVACVDYSAGMGGPLVAYRWDGEEELEARGFVSA